MTQSFPRAGQVHVSVKMIFLGDAKDLRQVGPLDIGRSREFGVMKAFEHAELLSWGIAFVIAVFSGISIYYVSAAGWGHVQGLSDAVPVGRWHGDGKDVLAGCSRTEQVSSCFRAHRYQRRILYARLH